MKTTFWIAMLPMLLVGATCLRAANEPPYPRSQVVTGITFDHATLERRAPGSDIWSCTWAGDGNVYAAWGDGGGFGGTDSRGRVSQGVAMITGTPPAFKGINVWGGLHPRSEQPATRGKGTIIAVHSRLYLYVSEQNRWNRCRLWESSDYGRTWQDKGWIFPRSHKVFAFPGLVQFGQNNRLSPGGYIYGFSDNDPRRVHDDRLYLFRVRANQAADLADYEYFAGTAQAPRWSHRLADRTPVFYNPAGVSWGTTCVYDSVLGRYLLSVSIHTEQGDWGLYESRNLWGPWRTVAYGNDFPAWTYSPAEKKRPAYTHTFPAKWISADGKTLWCVFDRGDHFNLARATLTVQSEARSIDAARAASGGWLLVANKGDRALGIVDPASEREVTTVPEEGITGHEVAASPDGRLAFVPIYGNSGVGGRGSNGRLLRVIDLDARRIVGTVDFGHGVRPHCAVIGPKDGLLYVTTELDDAITIIDPHTLKIVGKIPTGQPESHMLAISHDGRRGYTANVGPGTVSVLDMVHRKLLKVIPICRTTQRISVSMDDRWAFTADQRQPRLAVIDTAAEKLNGWIPLPGIGYGTAPTPNGRWLLVALSRANQVAVIDLRTRQVVRTLDVPPSPQELLVRPDGAVAYVSCDRSHEVAVLDLHHWRVANLIQVGHNDDGLAWAPAN